MPQDDQPETETDDETESENSSADADILEAAQDRYKADKNHWDPIFEKGRDDLQVLSDDESAMWDEKIYAERKKSGRPVVTVDYLTQFVHQVANNIRMNTPSINIIPEGGKATLEKAKKMKAAIRGIEYASCADEVYDTGATSAVKCSIGFALIDHDFIDNESFDQQLMIKRVVNPFLIYIDSMSIESDGRDMGHATILEKVKVSKFKKDNPGATISSFDDVESDRAYGDEDYIMIAQHFVKEVTETKKKAKNKKGADVERSTSKTVIHRYRLSGKQVLKKTTFPGDYIPVIPFYGEEAWIDGERNLMSLIRKAKSPQKDLCLKKSVETEVLMKQPIAPVMVPAGAIENYKEDWIDPSKSMALRYDMFDGQDRPLNPPQRLNPPQASAGFQLAAQVATDDIKAAMGLYNNAIGQQGQEVSGKAINARKIQGDVATYHFGDNTVRSITQIGRILVCAWNEINDTDRPINGIDEENKPITFGINGHKVEGQDESYDFSEDKYGVRVITGSNYTTMRQESAQFYQDVVKSSPDMMKVCGDLLFENMDINGSQELAARFKKLIDPKLLAKDGDEQDPQMQALQGQLQQAQTIIEQGAQAMQQLQQKLDDKNAGIMAKVEVDKEKNQLAMMQQQMDAQGQKFDQLTRLLELSMKDRSLDITEQNNAGNLAIKSKGMDFNAIMTMMQHISDQIQQANQPAIPGDMPANNGGITDGVTTDDAQ